MFTMHFNFNNRKSNLDMLREITSADRGLNQAGEAN